MQVSVLTVSVVVVVVAKINFSLLFLVPGVKNIEVPPPPRSAGFSPEVVIRWKVGQRSIK